MDKKTSTILLRVSLEQKELWVGQAHDERVSLSEWIRRRCNRGLGEGVSHEKGSEPVSASGNASDGRGTSSPSSFRPDPKSK